MNRREFLRTSATLGSAVAGFVLFPNLLHAGRTATETSEELSVESWLLLTGQDDLPADLYTEITLDLGVVNHRIFLPVVQQ